MIQDEIPAFINKKDLCTLSKNVVDLAYGGLEDRGIGEEIFLNPLYERIKRHTNPGRQIIDLMHKGIKLEKIIRDYGNLSSAV